jgi:hypothetical protein
MRSPADASLPSSRTATHGSGPMWIATPSSQWTCTTYSLPVSRRTRSDTHQCRERGACDDGFRCALPILLVARMSEAISGAVSEWSRISLRSSGLRIEYDFTISRRMASEVCIFVWLFRRFAIAVPTRAAPECVLLAAQCGMLTASCAPAISGAYPALHLVGLMLNHAAVCLTYSHGLGTEVSHDKTSNDYWFRCRRSACGGRNSLRRSRGPTSLKYARRDPVHSAKLRLGP